MGFVAGRIGLGLGELRLIGAGIELGQNLAFFNILPVLKTNADDGFRDHDATVAEFSAATLPNLVSTIGKFCFLDRVAITGTGGGASEIAAPGLRAKCCQDT
jgi:hypothetical protein